EESRCEHGSLARTLVGWEGVLMAGTRSRQRTAVGVERPRVVPDRTAAPPRRRGSGFSAIPALLAVLLLLVLTGCGSGAAGGSGTPQAGSTTGTETDEAS